MFRFVEVLVFLFFLFGCYVYMLVCEYNLIGYGIGLLICFGRLDKSFRILFCNFFKWYIKIKKC